MADAGFTNGTSIDMTLTSNKPRTVWVSPSTMDSNDTVTFPTITGKTLRVLNARDVTTGDAVTATVSSFTVTVDAAGGTTDHTYIVEVMYE